MRPPQPAPTYRDDAYAPFDGAGWRQIIRISDKKKQEYFSQQGWTGRVALKVLAKFAFWRTISHTFATELPASDFSPITDARPGPYWGLGLAYLREKDQYERFEQTVRDLGIDDEESAEVAESTFEKTVPAKKVHSS
jgi:hypothetical protein